MVDIKDHNPRLMPTWEEFKYLPKSLRVLTYFIATAILFMMITIVGYTMPFEPWRFQGYELIPNVVCEGDGVNVKYTAETKAGPYVLTNLTGEAYWVNEAGQASESLPVDIPLNATDKPVERRSPVKRATPNIPGEWRLGADVISHGYMFGFVPVQDEIKIVSDVSVTVLDDSDPRCGE